MRENKIKLSPRNMLAVVFTLSALPILIVVSLPGYFNFVMDAAPYVVFHNIAEFFSIMVSLSIFGIGWYTHDQTKDQHSLFLSTGFLAIGLMDFMHTLGNAAMPAFVTPNSSNKSTQYWIAARLFQAAVFLISAFIYSGEQRRWLSKRILISAALLITGVVFAGITFFPSSVPDTFIQGAGLTPYKIYSEYLVIVFLCLASAAYWQRMMRSGNRLLLYYLAALIISIFSEICLVVYTRAFDTYNVLGHIYKVASFFFIYKGIFIVSVKDPYTKLAEGEHARHLASFPELNPNPVLEIASSGKITFFNPATEKILVDLGMDRTDPSIFLPGDIDAILRDLEKRKESTLYREITLKDRVFGQTIYLTPQFNVVRVYVNDITERKRAETRLLLQARILDEISDAVVVTDLSFRITAWNHGAERMYGWKVNEVMGKPAKDVLRSELSDKQRAAILKELESDKPAYTEVVLFTKDGRKLIVDGNSIPLRNSEGDISGYVTVNHDITERKRVEGERERLLAEVQRQAAELNVHQLELQAQNEELRTAQVEMEASRRKYADLYNFAPLGYFTLDPYGLILEVNLPGANLLGMDKQALLKKPFSLFISGPHNQEVLSRHRKMTFASQNRQACDLRLKRKDGSVFYAHLESIAVENRDGNAGYIRTAVMDITERKRVEEELSRFSLIVESSEDAISSTDMEGILQTWNKGAEKVYGYRADEIIGQHVSILFPEQCAHEAPIILEKIGRGESIERLETERLRKDGKPIHVSITLSPVKNSTGTVVAISAITRDTTIQKQAEEALRRSEERFRNIFSQSPIGIGVYNAEGKLVELNQAAMNMFGLSRLDDMLGLGLFGSPTISAEKKTMLLKGDDIQEEVSYDFDSINESGFYKTEKTGISYFNRQITPLRSDSLDKPNGYLVQILDITERKRAEEALRESEERYRLLVEVSPDAIMIHDGRVFLFVNAAAVRLLGAGGPEQLTGRSIFSVLHPHFHQIVRERMEALKSDIRLLPRELKILRLDGSVIDVESTGSSMILHGRHVFQIIIRDITERKLAEKKLHKENRMIALVNRILEVFVKEAGDDMFDKALAIVMEGMKSRHGVFGYIDEHGDLICPTIAKLFDQCEMDDKCVCYTREKWKGLWSRALLEKRTLHSNVAAVVPAGHVPIRNNLATPILFQGEVIGLLNLANKETDYTEEDRECIETISKRIAPVLFAWIQKELRELERKSMEKELINLNEALEIRVRERTEDLAKTVATLQSEMADRNKAEEALRASRESLKKAQAIAHIGSWQFDRRTKKMTWSDELFAIFGLDPRAVEGHVQTMVWKAVHPQDREKVHKAFRQILSKSKAEPLEYRIVLPDGAQRMVWAEGERVLDESGSTSGFIGTVQDITERKRSEEEIVRLAAAVESAADAIVITENGAIRYVNSAFEKMTGYTRDEVMDRDLHLFDSGHHDETFFQQLREKLKKDGVWTGRLTNKKKDGTLYEEECTYAPIRGRSGEILNYIAIKRDVTEKVRLESIAQAVDTMNNIGYIFSGVRHEIGNPVTTIAISLNLLMKEIERLDRPTMEKHVKRCVEEIEKVDYLLRCLRNFNMFEQLEPRDIVLREFMNKLMALVKDDFTKKRIAILAVVEPEDANAYADPRALQQVLLNLLTNAADALEGRVDPKITVTVKKAKMIRIRVEDNGCGIPANRLQDIFKPFYTTKAHGTGLGIMIVRKMIIKMNGTLDLTSTEHKGTTVDISIPAS